jgi:hypothetical protein
LALFAREIAPAGTSWSPGTTGAGGRPSPSPMIRQYAFLLDKTALQSAVLMDGERTLVDIATHASQPVAEKAGNPANSLFAPALGDDPITVPLIQLAYARSGDKGDTSNIGIIARQPAFLPYIKASITEETLKAWLVHLVKGKVTRFDLPGINAVNFVCQQALGGGGMSSLRNDPLGKGMAQIILSMPVTLPKHLI